VLALETSFEGQCIRLGYSDDASTNDLSIVSYLNRSLSLTAYTGNARCIIHDNGPTNAYKTRLFLDVCSSNPLDVNLSMCSRVLFGTNFAGLQCSNHKNQPRDDMLMGREPIFLLFVSLPHLRA
jgi:hypothetical protein